ncbi:serine/threonine-protein kinase [Polyangium aurulentum]|uniref:serine/threonine-protein kinase n=1 Tax=Polyangium aurulentum TaxID=2567896 RepID=UPI0010AEAA78|nr:serine/threonine-protein kinase [Polyangium aurulentum]UQA62195.1 serine/threonine protein kinase [Polyangium aurulentum]
MSYPSDNRFTPRVGALIAGKYRIEKKLGEGGMGVVVAASHLQLGGKVALKFLVPGGENREDAIARLLREAQSAVRIKSDHVAKVLDVGTLDSGDPYIVMELLEGTDLNRLVSRNGPLPVADAVEYTLQAAEAVAEAHAIGIVHRDLKPANVFLTSKPDGSPFVKVLDFGIAKSIAPKEAGEVSLTVGGDVLGSPLYMSPEQIRNPKGVDPRADVWSLGAILYKLLTGRAAFEADNPSASLAMIIADDPTPPRTLRPGVPEGLEAVVLRCLEKGIDRRYQSVDELARDLLPFAPERPRGRPWAAPKGATSPAAPGGTARSPLAVATLRSAREQTPSTSRKSTVIVVAAMCAAAVLGGVGALLFLRASKGAPQETATPDPRPPEPPPAAAMTASPRPTLEPAPPPSAEGTGAQPAATAAPTNARKTAPPASATNRPRTSDDAALDDRL